MSRSPGLVALTRRRVATPRSAALVIVVLTMLAAFLVAAAPRALVTVLHDEVAFQVDQLSPTSRDLTAAVRAAPAEFGPASDTALTADWAPGADAVFGALTDTLAALRVEGGDDLVAVTSQASFYVYSSAFPVEPDPVQPSWPVQRVQLVADPAYRAHVTLVEGQWPGEVTSYPIPGAAEAFEADPVKWIPQAIDVVEIALLAPVAERMQWRVGETRQAGVTAEYVLTGILEANDPDDERWLHHLPVITIGTLFDDGNARPIVTGGAYVDPAAWPMARAVTGGLIYIDPRFPDRYASLNVESVVPIWYPLSARAVADREPAELLAQLRGFAAQSHAIADTDARARFDTDVTSTLSLALQRASSTSATLAVAAVGPIAVSVSLIVLAASLIIRRRRGDLLLLSARGTSLARLRRLLLWEGVLLGVIPAVAAVALALWLTPADAGLWPTALALLVGVVPAAALVLSLRARTLAGGRTDLGATRSGRGARLAQLLLYLLAALAVGLLIYRGVGRGSTEVDPLVIAAPLLATVALGLLAVKLHPIWLRAALGTAQRGRRVVGMVGAARGIRDPAAGTTAVLAMLVALAIAVFSSLILATVDLGARVAAERATGGDISVTGPVISADTAAAIAEIDGVAHVAGLYTAERMLVDTAAGREMTVLLVADIAALAAVQSDLREGIDAGALTAGQTPPQVLASPALAEDLGLREASSPIGDLTITAAIEALPGANSAEEFLLMDTDDYRALTQSDLAPRTLLVSLDDAADSGQVSAQISAAVDGAHVLRTLEARTAALQSSPAVSALRASLLGAIGLAVLLSVVAILLVAGVSRDARSRISALLRTMGLGRREGRGIVTWEFAPLGLSALVGGLVLGVALPLLVLASIDLRPFTGGRAQPGLTVDPALTLGLVAVVAIALAVAVIGGVLSARTTSLVTVLRTEEDR